MIVSQYFNVAISTIILIALLISVIKLKNKRDFLPLKLISFIILLMNIQFVGNSYTNFINFILITSLLFIMERTTTIKQPFSNNPIFQWKILTISIIVIVILSPSIFLNIQSYLKTIIKISSSNKTSIRQN